MHLFPKTTADWIRSLAHSLFASCLVVWLAVFLSGLRVWHHISSGGYLLLPALGAALGVICLFGKGLDETFRKLGIVVAISSVLLGVMLVPAVAH
jgi:hypothetical protein